MGLLITLPTLCLGDRLGLGDLRGLEGVLATLGTAFFLVAALMEVLPARLGLADRLVDLGLEEGVLRTLGTLCLGFAVD